MSCFRLPFRSLLTISVLLAFSATAQSAPAPLAVGAALQLPRPEATGGTTGVLCRSADPKVVQVFNNGFCFGLTPGRAEVEFRRAADGELLAKHEVEVVREEPRLLTADSFQQFPDNRMFTGRDGRKCFGSELNCKQAQSAGTVSNRVVNPAATSPDERTLWPVEKDTPVVDGTGELIGTMLPLEKEGRTFYATKVQHGMTKVLNGEIHIYAFATRVRLLADGGKGEPTGVSAWIPLRKVTDGEALLERLHPGTGRLPAVGLKEEKFPITGGDPNDYRTGDGTPLKIVKAVTTPPKPEDYLRREAGTVNVLCTVPGFGLGGHSLDSFLLSNRPVFRPAEGVRPITVPTYYPPGHPKVGEVTPKTMTFVYGAVDTEGSPRIYGWVAREALGGREAGD